MAQIFDSVFKIINIFSDTCSAAASCIAIYLFLFKRRSIKSVFNLLLNYSFQITLTELKAKLERLNDLRVGDSQQRDEVINILNEIVGQIRGNTLLREKFKDILAEITQYTNNPEKLVEPKKRSLICELREHLRSIDLQNIIKYSGGTHE